MKSLALENGRVWLEELHDPIAEGEWVVVEARAVPICGSDKAAFYSPQRITQPGVGHEGAGIVVEAARSSLLRRGDRVILNCLAGCGHCSLCRTGNYVYCPDKPRYDTHFAQYVKIQDFVCTILPEDIPYDIGAMACCALGPAFSSIKRMGLSGFDTLLVTGLGPVGMGAVLIGKYLRARVIALDTVPFRKALASELGADAIIDAADPEALALVLQAAAPGAIRHAVDASGNAAAERLCIDAVAPLGTVAFIGENFGEIPIRPSGDFIRKGLTLLGSWHYNLNDREAMLRLLRECPGVARLITAVYPLTRAQEAFEHFFGGDACKVVLHPWEV